MLGWTCNAVRFGANRISPLLDMEIVAPFTMTNTWISFLTLPKSINMVIGGQEGGFMNVQSCRLVGEGSLLNILT